LGTDRRTYRRVLTDRTDSVDPRPPQQHIILADKGFYPYIVISVARNERENKMKIFIGKVIATKNPKTATVLVTRAVTHPLYGKKMKREKKYQVHAEIEVQKGNIVKFVASKPYSKTKKWRIIK